MNSAANSACDHTVATSRTPQDAPEQGVALVGAARQPVGRHGDDGDDHGPDAVKQGLHPGQAPYVTYSQDRASTMRKDGTMKANPTSVAPSTPPWK